MWALIGSNKLPGIADDVVASPPLLRLTYSDWISTAGVTIVALWPFDWAQGGSGLQAFLPYSPPPSFLIRYAFVPKRYVSVMRDLRKHSDMFKEIVCSLAGNRRFKTPGHRLDTWHLQVATYVSQRTRAFVHKCIKQCGVSLLTNHWQMLLSYGSSITLGYIVYSTLLQSLSFHFESSKAGCDTLAWD